MDLFKSFARVGVTIPLIEAFGNPAALTPSLLPLSHHHHGGRD